MIGPKFASIAARTYDVRESIKAAIAEKGVTPGRTFREFARNIRDIPTGGGGSREGYRVRWMDFNGDILKEEFVREGQAATPPETPEHPHLIFNSWNWTESEYSNITENATIGAIYDTEDDLLWAHIRACKNVPITLGNSGVAHNWGDGTTDTLNTHTYSEDFDGFVSFNQKSIPSVRVGSSPDYYYRVELIEVYLPAGSSISSRSEVDYRPHLTTISFPSDLLVGDALIAEYALSMVKALSFPRSYTTVNVQYFGACQDISIPKNATSVEVAYTNLRYLDIPEGVTKMGLSNNSQLIKVIMPSTVNSGGLNGFFKNCSNLRYVRWGAGVSSIPEGCFSGCKSLVNIELPEGLQEIDTSNSAFNNVVYPFEWVFPSSMTKVNFKSFLGLNGGDRSKVSRIVFNSQVTLLNTLYLYDYAKGLQQIDIPQGFVWGADTSFKATVMAAANVVDFFEHLGATSTAVTLTFSTDIGNALTAEQKAIATNKGYTLAFS